MSDLTEDRDAVQDETVLLALFADRRSCITDGCLGDTESLIICYHCDAALPICAEHLDFILSEETEVIVMDQPECKHIMLKSLIGLI